MIVRNQGTIFLGGPPLVKAATGEVVTAEELGGGVTHSRISGVTDHLAENDHHALQIVRDIVATLPRCAALPYDLGPADPPGHDADTLYDVVPVELTPYDAREIITRLVDGSRFAEFKQEYGETLVTGFAHIHGHPVGIVANNGVLFAESAMKGAHFIETVRPTRHPAAVPPEHHRFHGGARIRARRHRQARREDGQRRRLRPRAQAHGRRGRVVRCRDLLHVRSRLLAALPLVVAGSTGVGHGRRTGGIRAVHRAGRAAQRRRQRLDRGGEGGRSKRPSATQYERQGSPYYSTARLWDDGVIEPAQTRDVLGLAPDVVSRVPMTDAGYGVFRM